VNSKTIVKAVENKSIILNNSQKINAEEGLTFDDVLLVPQYSDIEHRSEVSVNTKILPGLELEHPFVASNMDTVTEYNMAFSMAKFGATAVLHRYMTIDQMLDQIKEYKECFKREELQEKPLILSIGVHDNERIEAAYNAGVRNYCIDVAHGHHALVKKTILNLRSKYQNEIGIIAGNLATYEAARDLLDWGADCIKVGIGPGSVCTTRIKTGSGYPQLSAIVAAHQARKDFMAKTGKEAFIIADGGIKVYGDIAKAIAAGADAVMMGSIFSGCKETPGIVWRNEKEEMTKNYRGMASAPAQSDFGIDEINEEGVALTVKYKGSVRHILPRMTKGLRSGLSYSGSRNIKEFQEKAKFVRVTNSSIIEGKPHKAFS
jgi:IMP dehydrogenase